MLCKDATFGFYVNEARPAVEIPGRDCADLVVKFRVSVSVCAVLEKVVVRG